MLFFLNKWKKSCANQSMLVYIVWLQPCKNYTSSQSIVSICNKKKICHAFGFLFAQMGLIYIELHIWMNLYCQWKPLSAFHPTSFKTGENKGSLSNIVAGCVISIKLYFIIFIYSLTTVISKGDVSKHLAKVGEKSQLKGRHLYQTQAQRRATNCCDQLGSGENSKTVKRSTGRQLITGQQNQLDERLNKKLMT